MEIRTVKLSEIKPNPDNPRYIRDENYKKLVQSIKDFPEMRDIREIVVNKDMVILGGNMRYRAMQEAGIKETQVKIVDLSEEKQREFIIKDNLESGEWNWDELANSWEQEKLEEWGLDTQKDWVREVIEDEAPEISNEPAISKLGEIYQLGRHRVMCGDSTKIEDVEKLMGEQRADLLLTDPPYNVEYVGKTKDALTIKNDRMENDGFLQFLTDAFETMFMFAKEGASFYIWHADSEGYNFRTACKQIGFTVRQCLIWNKNSMVMGRQDYQWKHEPCLYGWKDGASHSWYADRKQTTIIDFDRPTKSEDHPTMKPVGLMSYCINNSSKSGDIILDIFLGSGSTLIACEQTNRTCYGMELDPKYVDVIRKRYTKYTYPDKWEKEWESLTPKI